MIHRREFMSTVGAASLASACAHDGARASAFDAPPGLRAYLLAEMERARIPGMQIAIVRQGRMAYWDAFGLADIENPVPATNATRFQIASITKAFVGVAIMQLVEAGQLDLAAPATSYLGGSPNAWREATVAHLATHMSGLPDISVDNRERLVVDGDAEASLATVQTLPLRFRPGERFDYNQTNYVLLGKIVETVAKEPFSAFIQRRQLDVVGMPGTVFGDDRDVVRNSARTYTPYALVGGRPQRGDTLYKVYVELPPMLRACGGLNSTAEDMARWLIAIERGDLFQSPSTLTRCARRNG